MIALLAAGIAGALVGAGGLIAAVRLAPHRVALPPAVVADVERAMELAGFTAAGGTRSAAMEQPARQVVFRTLDAIDSSATWQGGGENDAKVAVSLDNGSLKLDFDFRTGKWLQIEKSISFDVRGWGAFTFRARGEGSSNDLQFKIVDIDGVTFGRTFPGITATAEWRKFEIPISSLTHFWGGDGEFDWAALRKIFFSVSATSGGAGKVWIDDLRLEAQALSPPEPQANFETVRGDATVARKAAAWIASMQKPSGFILSYEGDDIPFAWTYDQALSLIVLSHTDTAAAVRLLEALQKAQKPEGYWNDGFVLDLSQNKKPMDRWIPSTVPGVAHEFDNRWVGSVSWVVHAIDRYMKITDDHRWDGMVKKAAEWLSKEQRADGSLHDATEGNLDAWWALQAGGRDAEAAKLKTYLLGKVWNESEGRMYVSPGNPQPYLDGCTWGSAFLIAAGDRSKALRALTFAGWHFACTTYDKRTRGLDTTGPHTVWNEGTLQYICAGGAGAQGYLAEMNKQQREDGALQHSHEEITKGGTWHTTMYGVCPSAWLYFANAGGEPFPREGA